MECLLRACLSSGPVSGLIYDKKHVALLGKENMGFKRLLLLSTAVLFAALLCAGCQGKEKDTTPLKINEEKDVHGLYEKVVKEREKTAKPKQKGKETESKKPNQTSAGSGEKK